MSEYVALNLSGTTKTVVREDDGSGCRYCGKSGSVYPKCPVCGTKGNPMSDWRPIESAPKDGAFLLLMFEYGMRIGSYLPWRDSSYPMLWQSQDGASLHRPWKGEAGPTYWQPLPERPHD